MHLPTCQISSQSKLAFYRMPLSQFFFLEPCRATGAAIKGRRRQWGAAAFSNLHVALPEGVIFLALKYLQSIPPLS